MENEHPIAALAEALEVSPSGFHAHRRKVQSQRRRQDDALAAAIAPIFTASRQTYGCPRVTAALHQQGLRCGKNRVARLMRENRLVSRQKRKRWRPTTTNSGHRRSVAENWLAKVPAPTSLIRYGWPTSPTLTRARAGCIWPASSTHAHADWWAGRRARCSTPAW